LKYFNLKNKKTLKSKSYTLLSVFLLMFLLFNKLEY